jgi:MFS superfamily sulfate permease-like transporter
MADTDLPQNWEGASRWFLGGTIVFASGFEAVVLFWEGKFRLAGSSFTVAVVLIAILIYWDRLKSKMPRVMNALAIAVADARLWAIMLLALAAFAGGLNLQREWSDWIYTLPFFIGLTFLCCLALPSPFQAGNSHPRSKLSGCKPNT